MRGHSGGTNTVNYSVSALVDLQFPARKRFVYIALDRKSLDTLVWGIHLRKGVAPKIARTIYYDWPYQCASNACFFATAKCH